jgi:hypothetical protein
MSHAIKLAITASVTVRFLACEISSQTWRQKFFIVLRYPPQCRDCAVGPGLFQSD